MFSSLTSLGLMGIEPYKITVEVKLARAMPSFDIIGLPDAAIKESRDRIRSVLTGYGFSFPDNKIVVNLAPADIKKEGSIYDLPIFIGLMGAMGEINSDFKDMVFLGELSLSGTIHPINGVLPMLIDAQKMGIKKAFIPYANAAEATAVEGIEIYALKTAEQLISYFKHNTPLEMADTVKFEDIPIEELPDFSDVRGQQAAKRALEIAAAGGHNILLIGSPGAGKSMLAKRLPSILPEMTNEESIQITKIYSACGLLPSGVHLLKSRPFRSPHHTISTAGLCGGGSVPRPGEISLAHNGVLFLDELPEFNRQAMEALRQPLENGEIVITRSKSSSKYPSRIMLATAMNPCPCGYFGHPTKACICTSPKVSTYLAKVSGPLLDRIDLHVEVLPVDYEQISSKEPEERSELIKTRVCAARLLQTKRYAQMGIHCNADITPKLLRQYCVLSEKADQMLSKIFEKMAFSGRGYDRILKVARTIADLDQSEIIDTDHLAEAVQYRSLDRKYWGRG